MAEQLLLPGIDAPGEDNLLFAIRPERKAAERIEGLALDCCEEFGLVGTLIEKERLHISLRGMKTCDVVPAFMREKLETAANAVSMPSFEARFGRVMSFRRNAPKRAFVLVADGDGGLRTLWQSLGIEMRRVGLWRHVGSSFKPHVTMLYDRRMVAERSVEPIIWTVRDFVLIHSLVGESTHIPLGKWSLRG